VFEVVFELLKVRSAGEFFIKLRFVELGNTVRQQGHQVVVFVDVEYWAVIFVLQAVSEIGTEFGFSGPDFPFDDDGEIADAVI
jgi:hypothetical protein